MQLDFTPIIAQVFTGFLYLLPILLLIAFFKSARFKGAMGEWAVNVASSLALNKRDYHLIKDVTLPTEDGGTTQIDHIIVSRYGIFVVETKNMQGWIFGGDYQPMWTQKIYKQSFKFQNPLRQNYKHLKTLQACLDVELKHLHSVIVFTGDCTFKTPLPENVVRAGGYIRYIKSWTEGVFSPEQVQEYITAIESGRLEPSAATRKAHIQHLKGAVNQPQSKPPNCPKCGSQMVMRETRNGPNVGRMFWGCSHFPRCRGMVSIKD
ncbi:nuclease-related domain-containing protein [Thiothrix subterranea]|uniref:NERD domain-containing protein n=1 Tax=Thiothrix subterranea TaxID=2735563 RepID=A0AA51MM04_9GAMM|nr:NERD domain-containing protein [Thiothrix subterranea]MDQ5767898.1 NERD domain-containing protein [Thiothrix subterranea]WML86643.1 NERD domain-containing protein [Thiothrix subterranea]